MWLIIYFINFLSIVCFKRRCRLFDTNEYSNNAFWKFWNSSEVNKLMTYINPTFSKFLKYTYFLYHHLGLFGEVSFLFSPADLPSTRSYALKGAGRSTVSRQVRWGTKSFEVFVFLGLSVWFWFLLLFLRFNLFDSWVEVFNFIFFDFSCNDSFNLPIMLQYLLSYCLYFLLLSLRNFTDHQQVLVLDNEGEDGIVIKM